MKLVILLFGCAPQTSSTRAPAPSPAPYRACEACRTDLQRCQITRAARTATGDLLMQCTNEFMDCLRERGLGPERCVSAD